MTTNGSPLDPLSPRHEPDISEQNVARLLGQAYQPERPDPGFVETLQQKLQASAPQAAAGRRWSAWRTHRTWALGAAAALVGVLVGLHALLNQAPEAPPAPPGSVDYSMTSGVPAPAGVESAEVKDVQDRLTARRHS